MCAFGAVWTSVVFSVNDNLAIFKRSSSSSKPKHGRRQSAITTHIVVEDWDLLQTLVQQAHVPNDQPVGDASQTR